MGQIRRSGTARSTAERLRHALGPQGLGQPDVPLGAWFGQTTRANERSDRTPGGLAESAQEFIGADRPGRGADPLGGGGVAAIAGALLAGSGS